MKDCGMRAADILARAVSPGADGCCSGAVLCVCVCVSEREIPVSRFSSSCIHKLGINQLQKPETSCLRSATAFKSRNADERFMKCWTQLNELMLNSRLRFTCGPPDGRTRVRVPQVWFRGLSSCALAGVCLGCSGVQVPRLWRRLQCCRRAERKTCERDRYRERDRSRCCDEVVLDIPHNGSLIQKRFVIRTGKNTSRSPVPERRLMSRHLGKPHQSISCLHLFAIMLRIQQVCVTPEQVRTKQEFRYRRAPVVFINSE
ncbi:hypothetical protein F2P79_019208 [Pimephales promelas]|nr:hypothetical protein F2P79_019208 [Pimephales promelas]